MKRRVNQLIAVQAEFDDGNGNFKRDPFRTMRPMIMAGGPYAEHNRQAFLDGMREQMREYDPECQWRARIVYRWRSPRHLWRWIRRGGRFRGGS